MSRTPAKANILHVEFWSDRFVQRALSIDQALFYLMLMTRWPERLTGIVEVPVPDLCHQFRPGEFSIERVLTTLATLEEAGRIVYDTDTLWVVNYFKRHTESAAGRPAFYGPVIARQLGTCASEPIYRGFTKKYAGHPLLPVPLPPYRYNGAAPPAWFSMGGPVPAPRKRPPIPPAPAPPPEQTVPEVRAEVQRVWDAYVEIMGSTMSLTATRRAKILTRLGDKITDPVTRRLRSATADDLIAAIRACHASPWHMGDNKERTLKNAPEVFIWKNQEQLETWLQQAAKLAAPSDTPLTDAGLLSDRTRERELTRMAREGPLRLPGHPGWDIEVERGMTTADWTRFLVVMARYEAAFPNQKKLNAVATADRFQALHVLDIETLEGAVPDTLLACGDFFPSTALQFDIAAAWGKVERARRADARATTHGLPSAATLSAEEALEIETQAHAERARLRRRLAEPFVDPPRPCAGRFSSTPEPLKEILARTMPHETPPDADPQLERPTE